MAVNENTLLRRSENLKLPESDASVTDRVRYLITRLRKTQQQFANLMGIDGPNLSRILNGRTPFSDAMINRIVVNLGVSKEWLLNGTDVPFPKATERSIEIYEDNEPRQLNSKGVGIPVYDIDATAGFAQISSMFTNDNIIGYLQLPQANPADVLVRVSGESMVPQVPNGAYIAIRPVNPDAPIFWGQMYLVMMDDYRMVKVLRRHNNPEKVILHSYNPEFDDMEVNRDDIRQIYIVDAVLNYNILT